ncbi:MAG TPA: M56 family metallopeptidase [Rhizomicrobium sp.]|nr:M56 family metallopeptidase [Rhizomicrobium sp.]
MIAALLNHLWQSTLFAAGIWLLTLAVRRNAASIRYGLWFTASVKFMIPFSIFAGLGGALAPITASQIALPPEIYRIQDAAMAFAAPSPILSSPTAAGLDPFVVLAGLWVCGIMAVFLIWLARWLQIRAVLRAASPLLLAAPIPVKSTTSSLGPGLFGIWRPVLLLPQDIAARLTQREMRAILDHELCHLDRHDNLTAAIHMAVEALFWFHPLVWWLGARMIAEREQACDESVVEAGNDAGVYAEGILKVCRFYAGPSPPLAAAVLGTGLEARLETIMAGHVVSELTAAQRALLRFCVLLAVAWPLLSGWTDAIQDRIPRAVAPVAGDAATVAGVRRYMAQLQMGKRSAAERVQDGGLWHEDTTSRAECESHFLAVLQLLEKGYGKFAPLYPQRMKNDQDRLPISLMWKNGLGDSRYQEATVYMSDETAHVWDARRLFDGRTIDAAAVWSAESESTDAVCLTEINVRA